MAGPGLLVGINALAETYATDSFQNLLFSILLFRYHTGRHPDFITVISHDFKKDRFLDLHCAAIRWPLEKIRYIGPVPLGGMAKIDALRRAEMENGYGQWKVDPYGANFFLSKKRQHRGW